MYFGLLPRHQVGHALPDYNDDEEWSRMDKVPWREVAARRQILVMKRGRAEGVQCQEARRVINVQAKQQIA